MKLTIEQYNLVSQYCSKSGKYFYDVEIELTDHMTNYIEDRMISSDDFKKLFEQIKTELNKNEIDNIIKEKVVAIENNIKQQLKVEMFQYLTLPKIAITFLLIVIVIWIHQNKNIEKAAGSFIHILNILNLTYNFGKGKSALTNIRDKKKILLSMKIVGDYHLILILPTIFYLLISLEIIFEMTLSNLFIYQLSLYMLPLVILMNLAWQKVYINTQLKIRRDYPKAFAC